jgi:GAF domain-containing protein
MDVDNGDWWNNPHGGRGRAPRGTVASPSLELLVDVLAAAPVGMGLLDAELRWVYANDAFFRATGLEPARIMGRPVAATPFAADLRAISRTLVDGAPDPSDMTGDGGEVEPFTATKTGWRVRYRRLEAQGNVTGVVAVVMGAATRHQRHLDLARRRLALQESAAERIGTTLDVDITCVEIAELTVPAMADLAMVHVMPYEAAGGSHGVPSEVSRLRRAAFACAPDLRRALGSLTMLGTSARPGAGSAMARSLAEGRLVIANLLSDDELAAWADSAETVAAYRLADVDSVLAVPLNARGRLVGVMTLARARGTSEGFTADDAVLIKDLADRAAVSVENARQYADSQSVTLQLQRALLIEPGRPHSNLEVATRYLPSGNRTLVGGDWYEVVRLPFGRTLLVMGDVMGHGVEAAVDMSIYRSAIRDAGGMDLPPKGILRHLDTLISQDPSARPATCLLGVADPNRRRWTFASAGHLPPALFTAGGATELVAIPTGPPLGTGLGGYEQVTVDLVPDQILLVYTDGLVERRGEDIDVSLARLASLPLPASGDLEHLLDDALRLVAPPVVEDDIALLAARAPRR